MLQELKPLYKLGFALHLLYPKSKSPIGKGWSKAPRASFKDLITQYQKGMNVGVRLGSWSKIGDVGYLAAIDCDVKSSKDEHLFEMSEKLRRLFPKLKTAAIVASGRGNGSRHYYVVTKEPVSTRRLAQSSEKVLVKMPSVSPSPHELKTLSKKQLAQGWRLRPAWEISIMGTGSQTVLPPSIHPDTGRAYTWSREWKQACVVEVPEVKKEATVEARELSTFPEVDLGRLPEDIVAMIVQGEGVEDRSAALFKVAMSMLKHSYTEEEVAAVLTDRENFLGEVAYDHAKTENRTRAAKWILKYTLPRAKQETDPGRAFMEEEPPKLSKKAAKKQMEEIEEGELASSWETRLERTAPQAGSKVKATLKNLVAIFENDVCRDVFRRDEFAGLEIYGCPTPWGGKTGRELGDGDLVDIKKWLADHWGVEPNVNLINEAIAWIARRHAFHPVRNYLDGLVWDGKERINTWLRDYMGAEAEEPYLSAVSRKLLVAMIARIYEPGRKFDQVVILQGHQGKGKSTALRMLTGDEWFSDATLNVTDKDTVVGMRAIWLRELGELSGMRKTDVEQLKEFISRNVDRIRLPYGKRTEAFPRQCIFVGTTNKDEFLRDDTGNRRFWPVTVGKCHFERIARDRDQLFAEARIAYELGEELFLDDEEAAAVAQREQERRMESDTLEDAVRGFIKANRKKPQEERFDFTKFTLHDAFSAGVFVATKDDRGGQMRAASVLRKLGFEKHDVRGKDGRVRKYWSVATLK